jgi:hypothetical protein
VSQNKIFQPSTAWENQVVKTVVLYLLHIFQLDIDKQEDPWPLRCAYYTLLSNMQVGNTHTQGRRHLLFFIPSV